MQYAGSVILLCGALASLASASCGASDDAIGDESATLPGDTARFDSARRHTGGGRTATTTGSSSVSTTGAGGSTGGSGGAGGAGGGGTVVGCDVCTKANDCCNVVGGGPLCTFSAATCSTVAESS